MVGWLVDRIDQICVQFSRTVGPYTGIGPTIISFMGSNNWNKASVLTSSEEAFLRTGFVLTGQLRAAGMEVLQPTAFVPGSFNAGVLREIKRSGIRMCADQPSRPA